jgi:hypothetical protein
VRSFALRGNESSWKQSSDTTRSLTVLEADVLAATWQGSRSGFDQTLEHARRRDEVRIRLERINVVQRARQAGVQSFDDVSLKVYLDACARKRCPDFRDLEAAPTGTIPSHNNMYANAGPAFFEGKRPPAGNAADFDPEAWEIRPPDASTIATILKANGIKYTKNSNPTSCPVHDKGPVQEALLKVTGDLLKDIFVQLDRLAGAEIDAAVQAEIDSLRAQQRQLEVEQQKLTKKVEFYHQHLEQYATARAAAKDHEADVRMGNGTTTRSKIVWYRDFVNHHDCDGSKIHDYVLVWVYRDSTDPLSSIKKYVVHNVTSDPATNKADTAMVHDFVDHHLSGRSRVADDLISRLKAASCDGIIELVQSGDHGTDLNCVATTLLWTKLRFSIYTTWTFVGCRCVATTRTILVTQEGRFLCG